MPSPFPGMDPYLERPTLWPDLHLELIRAVRAALVPKVAPRYYVAVEQRTYIVAADPFDAAQGKPHTFVGRPAVTVVSPLEGPAEPPVAVASVAVLERPVTVELPLPDRIRQRYLEVRDVETHEVVTVIEILSPTNKRPGPDRQQYERKRLEVLDALTNLV